MAGSSSNFPNRPFQLRDVTTITRQDVANNRTLMHFQVWIYKTAYSPTYSNGGTAYARWGYDNTPRASTDPGKFDFQASGPWLWLEGDIWITHTANGTKTITVNVGADFTTLGATSYSYGWTLPPIARNPPPAPTPLNLSNITRNSMTYRFQSNGDGGSALIRWDAQYSTSSDFTTGVVTVTSTGTTTINTLRPGTMYYWRSRGVNAAGNGAWSTVLSARTLSAAWISNGTEWVPADVLISDGTTWKPADIFISNGTTWGPTG